MRIYSSKIPLKMKALPELYVFLNKHGERFIPLLAHEVFHCKEKPTSCNASLAHIADRINEFSDDNICFKFYASKNIFIGHNVISHADRRSVINYNTRFHSCGSYTLPQWIENFGHELTHLADQRSPLSFSHKSQSEKTAAPFIVGAKAKELYLSREWL